MTAEYGMLPGATHTRGSREAARGKQSGRTWKYKGLSVVRCAVVDLKALGERTVTLDCDVIQADGGTRTASISGAFVALSLAAQRLLAKKSIKTNPIHGQVAAVSVGVYRGMPVLDLDYAEDSQAETDMNVVMNESGGFIELQGTAEGHAFRDDELQAMLALARKGIGEIVKAQEEVLGVSFVLPAEIVLASGNQGKLKELSELLSDCPNTLVAIGIRR